MPSPTQRLAMLQETRAVVQDRLDALIAEQANLQGAAARLAVIAGKLDETVGFLAELDQRIQNLKTQLGLP